MNLSALELLIKNLLIEIGEDPNREGILETPKRVAKFYTQILSGYEQKPEDVLGKAFTSDNDQMVVVKDIDFFSMCEHHMCPFFGRVHIGYIPKGKVLGLSKFARLVNVFAKRLQIQEQLTEQIADALDTYLKPAGVIVVINSSHLCMQMRGVEKLNSSTVTSAIRGDFRSNPSMKQEFFNLIKNG